MNHLIEKLSEKIEDLCEQLSNKEILPFFAQDKAEKLYEEAKRLKIYFISLKAEDFIIEKINVVISNAKQLCDDIADIIDFEKGISK